MINSGADVSNPPDIAINRALSTTRNRHSVGGPATGPPRATLTIKVAVEAALGKRDHVSVLGTDFDTPDGTGVRDYIHVSDLANADVLALRR